MSLKTVIGSTIVFLVLYAVVVLAGWERMALLLFSLSPVVVIYMAYRILKDPYSPKDTFEEKFYEDYNYRRNT